MKFDQDQGVVEDMLVVAGKLVSDIQREIDLSRDFMRRFGFDPDEVPSLMRPEQHAEVQRLLQEDLRSVEREVEIARGRAGVGDSARSGRRAMRLGMV